MGLGLAILANVRPYEGFVLSLPVAAGLLILDEWLGGTHPVNIVEASRFTFGAAAWNDARAMAYYNWRVTGNPLRTPYDVSMSTMNPVPTSHGNPCDPSELPLQGFSRFLY